MNVLKALVFSNIWVAVVLASLGWSSYILIDVEPRWYVISCIFLGSYTLYNFHRLYKIDFIPIEQRGDRHTWMVGHASFIKISMAIAVFFSMLLLPNYQAKDIVWLVPAGIISVGYTIPFIPTHSHWWRLRDIPLLKPIIIAFVVAYLTLCFPIFEHGTIGDVFLAKNMQLFIERFVFLAAVTIPFEMRDMQSDSYAGLKTLATYLGFNFAKRLAYATIILWLVLWVIRAYSDFEFTSLLVGFLIFVLGVIAIFNLNAQRRELFFIFSFEGLILVYSALIILFL
ncbi:MAG: hypothetical protein Salg2KO_05920 [Salibacteraceae bacterium]